MNTNLEFLSTRRFPPVPVGASSDVAVLKSMMSEMREQLDRLHEISEEFVRLRKRLMPPNAIRNAPRVPRPRMGGKPRLVTLSEVAEAVAVEFDVPMKHFYTERRFQGMALVRRVLWQVAFSLTGLSVSQIARDCERHHTTVLYGLTRLRKEMVVDGKLAARVRRLIWRLSGEEIAVGKRAGVGITDVVDAVAREFEVHSSVIKRKGNGHFEGRLRAVCCFVANRNTLYGHSDMAAFFGRSLIAARKGSMRVRDRMVIDDDFAKHVQRIEERIRAMKDEESSC